MKHTKGPWRISKYAKFNIENSTGRSVASAGGYSSNTNGEKIYNENIANAKLIAAAPDLLQALLDIIVQAERLPYGLPADLSDSIKILGKQAIKKATE